MLTYARGPYVHAMVATVCAGGSGLLWKATIMKTAIAKWGCNIGDDAASRAADCCGFSTETVRQWAFAYITTTPMSSEDDI